MFFNNFSKFAEVESVFKRGGKFYIGNREVKDPPEKAIRWRTELRYPYPTLNSRESVIMGNNKFLQRKALQDAGVSVPKSWFEKQNSFPCLARPTRHARGTGFHIINSKKELDALPKRNWYYSEWIEKKEEYRVYVGGDKVLGAFRKPIEGHTRGHLAITGSWGELLMPSKDICDLAIESNKTLGLDFSGIDVIVGEKPYCIECNTAPMAITEDVAELLTKYFIKCLK